MSIHDMCHPCLVKYNYIAKLETMNQDSAYLLHRISNNIVQFPDKHLDPKSDSVTDSNFTDIFHRYYSSVPIKVVDGIRKLYALDFEMFGYDINEVWYNGNILSMNDNNELYLFSQKHKVGIWYLENIHTQFYSTNGRLVRTKCYSSNRIAISDSTSDWHSKTCRSVRKYWNDDENQ